MGGLGVKFQHFPLTLLVVLTTLTLPCERDPKYDRCKNLFMLDLNVSRLGQIRCLVCVD